jgi:Tfp pilus assembly protein PilF
MRTATTLRGRAGLRVAALLLAGTAILAACGGGGDDGGSKSATALLNEALQAQVQGDTSQASAKFEEVLKVDPSNKFAHYNLGYIAQTTGDSSEAMSQYRDAIAEDASYAPALYNLALLTCPASSGRFQCTGSAQKEAIDLYRQATKANPKFDRAFLNLGLLLSQTGDKAGADQALRTAVKLNPDYASRIPANAKPSGT